MTTVLEKNMLFKKRYRKQVRLGDVTWDYYRLGQGNPILWLTGGLRRTSLAFDFLERLSRQHTVIAPDYPPVMTIQSYLDAFSAMLHTENVERCAVAGQSYGGMLAQAWLAFCPQAVERLILSSSGPADYQKGWLPLEWLLIGLARLWPEDSLKNMLVGGLFKLVTVPPAEKQDWQEAMQEVLHSELSRLDVVSHFAVAANLIQRSLIKPGCFSDWKGRLVVMSSTNDRTQGEGDLRHYQRMFNRLPETIDMGSMGHTAVLFDPQRFLQFFEQALA